MAMDLLRDSSDKFRRWPRRFSDIVRTERLLSSPSLPKKHVGIFTKRLEALNPSLCVSCIAMIESQVVKRQKVVKDYEASETCPLCSLVRKARIHRTCYSPEIFGPEKLLLRAMSSILRPPGVYRLVFTDQPSSPDSQNTAICDVILSSDAAIKYKKYRNLSEPLGAGEHSMESTSSYRNMSRLLEWISHCNETHDCTNSIGSWSPTRLLDLDYSTDHIRVIQSQDKEFTTYRYATLSHCWSVPPWLSFSLSSIYGIRLSEVRGQNWSSLIFLVEFKTLFNNSVKSSLTAVFALGEDICPLGWCRRTWTLFSKAAQWIGCLKASETLSKLQGPSKFGTYG